MRQTNALQRGFAAIAAIFLVVGLAALGAFMVTFSNAQQLTSAQDYLGSRAYWAARGGLEWAIVAIPATPTLCPNATATLVTGAVPATIDGFTVRIFCTRSVYSEAGVPRTVYQFESRVFSSGAVGSIAYIERSLSASLEQ